MSCIDQPRRSLLHAAIERGLRYTDITPHLVELGSGAAFEEIGAAECVSERPNHHVRDAGDDPRS